MAVMTATPGADRRDLGGGPTQLRIRLVDDHELVRGGIRAMPAASLMAGAAGYVLSRSRAANRRARFARWAPFRVCLTRRWPAPCWSGYAETNTCSRTRNWRDSRRRRKNPGPRGWREVERRDWNGDVPCRKTVKTYVSSIQEKLEVARRAEAAGYLAGHSGKPIYW